LWGEPDPDHGNNSAHHEEAEKSNQILALVTGVVAASIFFEKLKDYIEESVESEELKPIVRHLFGELTVLGFIGLVIFILDKTGIPKEWTEKTEQIHIVIFVVSLVFLSSVMILVRFGKTMATAWREAEDCVIDPIHDRIGLVDDYLYAKDKAKNSMGFFFSVLDQGKRLPACKISTGIPRYSGRLLATRGEDRSPRGQPVGSKEDGKVPNGRFQPCRLLELVHG
jgi:hypothetical protein